MKISVIGAGNVGSTLAMRLCQQNLGQVVLVDIVKGLAKAKAFDLDDCRYLLKLNYHILGTEDMGQIKDSDIVVVTAGLARRPGMTREDLLNKNAAILKDISLSIKNFSPGAVVIIVTNPLDIMTAYALRVTGFNPSRLFGMGVSLDAARFANLISEELKIPVTDIDAVVIGSHGEGMIPLERFSSIKGVPLDEFIDQKKRDELLKKTVQRGAEIVSLLGSGSAYYAPSAAAASLVAAIIKDEKRTIGACAQLNGEYGLTGVCIGVPCRIGKRGIESIVELDLNKEEKEKLAKSADSIKELISSLPGI